VSEIQYKIHRTVGGAVRLKYLCPKCQEKLESDIEEAGKQDTCPNCSEGFLVPGVAQLQSYQAALSREQSKRLESRAKNREALATAAKAVTQKVADYAKSIPAALAERAEINEREAALEAKRQAEWEAARDMKNRYHAVRIGDVDLRTIAFELFELNQLMLAAHQRQRIAGLILLLAGLGCGCMTAVTHVDSDTVLQQIHGQIGFAFAGILFWFGVAKMIGG
jgi:DNA-directed RNA polymerase subunit RPC12/RpoP